MRLEWLDVFLLWVWIVVLYFFGAQSLQHTIVFVAVYILCRFLGHWSTKSKDDELE